MPHQARSRQMFAKSQMICAALMLSLTLVASAQASVFSEFATSTDQAYPEGITAGPDGALWFAESRFGAGKIGCVTPEGVVRAHPTPANGMPHAIAKGPDGSLWFTQPRLDVSAVGRVTPN